MTLGSTNSSWYWTTVLFPASVFLSGVRSKISADNITAFGIRHDTTKKDFLVTVTVTVPVTVPVTEHGQAGGNLP